VALVIFLIFALHTLLALRKIPDGYRQWRAWLRHMRGMRHEETSLWLLQVVTGFVLMFFATAHLLELFIHPADIGPHASAARIAGGGWLLGLVLLFSVEVHAGIGLYRLRSSGAGSVSTDSALRRRRLRRAVYLLVTFFLLLGADHAVRLPAHRQLAEEAVQAGRALPPGAVESGY
jgi:fumarate reductase subunit C